MCGICGVISPQLFPEAGGLLQRMNDSLHHRGPDDAGFWLLGEGEQSLHFADHDSHADIKSQLTTLDVPLAAHIGFGHRRLSIIDLTVASHQPLQSTDKRYILCYNGELYNYIELRATLTTLGHTFQSHGDAEVLLAAWEEWQDEALHRFEGMWAFALYDLKLDKLWLVRDPSGVKPLFYAQKGAVLIFASEPKALLASGLVPNTLNEKALYSFLIHGALDEAEGHLLQVVNELPAGNLLCYDRLSGSMASRNYHSAHFKAGLKQEVALDNLTQDILKKLENAVRLRLRSDVKIGASLSGGLDSATLAVLAAQKLDLPLFTAVYEGYPENEAHYAKEVAKKLKADWHAVQVTPELIVNRLESLVQIQDGPILALSTFAQLFINEAAKAQGVTILLDGQGGDELFSGYDRYWLSYYREAWEKFDLGALTQGIRSVFHFKILLKSMVIAFFPAFLLHKGLKPVLVRQLKRRKPELAYLKPEFKDKHWNVSLKVIQNLPKSGVNAQQIEEMYGYDLKNLLHWGDRNSMSVAIENRAPFADDPHLAQLLLGLPASLKMRAGRSKLLLRSAMQGRLPEIILKRTDKQGFTTPMKAWMAALWPQWKMYLQYLPESIDIKMVERDSEKLLSTQEGTAFLLRLLSLGAWLKNLQTSVKSV